MAYETGNASNVETLLSALGVFAASKGWTVHYSGPRTVAGATPGTSLIVSRNLAHTNFKSFISTSVPSAATSLVPYITINGHDAYNPANGTESQENGSGLSLANLLTGPFASYHFFANENPSGDTYLYVVVEKSPGLYRHFGTGILNKFGGVTTGHFVYGTMWDPSYASDENSNQHHCPFDSNDFEAGYRNYVRADRDGVVNRWNATSGSLGFFGSRSTVYAFASGQTQRAVLWPFLAYVSRPGDSNSFLGMPPNVRAVSLQFLNAGENLTLGSDTWKVFPVVRRNGNLGEEDSGTYGIAYKV